MRGIDGAHGDFRGSTSLGVAVAQALERVGLRRVLGGTLKDRAADHVEGRVTRGLSLGRLRAPALSGHELRMRVCARKVTGIAPAAPRAAKARKPRKPRRSALTQRR